MLTLNPGFALIIAALAVLAMPRAWRPAMMAGSALLAFVLLLGREFGAADAVAQMGLPVVFLNLDALNRIFGIALLIALIGVAIHSGARRNAYEDSAILFLAGGSLSALFVGDLLSFVAAAAVAGLSASWVVLASPHEGANACGARLLIWNGLEGLLFLVGVALHLTSGAQSSVLSRLDAATISGACIFAALMIRVAGPFAHVWFKDAAAHASPVGSGAIAAFTTMLGVYALVRLFPAEPLLMPLGGAMILIGAFYASAEDDVRRAGAYAMIAQTGICVALIGIGSPIAMAAAEGHAFAITLAFASFQLLAGAVATRTQSARVSQIVGAWAEMPVTSVLLILAATALCGAPGFAVFATQAVALEAAAAWDFRVLWALIVCTPALLFAGVLLRVALAVFAGGERPARRIEAPFAMLLGAGVLLFFSAAVGLAPRWLYDLMPSDLAFDPFGGARFGLQLELLGAAGVIYALFSLTGLLSRQRGADLLDVDAFYRGPLAGAGQWIGAQALGAYDLAQSSFGRIATFAGDRLSRWTQTWDKPYAPHLGNVFQFLAVAAVLGAMLLSASQR